MGRKTTSEMVFWAFRLASVTTVFLILDGCGGSGREAIKPEAGPPAPKANEESAAGYVVEQLPGGIIAGRILFKGKPLPPRIVPVTQDAAYCGARREIFPLRVEKGGLAEAVIWIDDIQRGKPYAFSGSVLEQKRCTYVPHVLLMQPGELKIESDDPIPHNVHTYAQFNREYNESMNPLHRTITLRFARPDRISTRCDLHGWMQAYLLVAKNPYYVISSSEGSYVLNDVPAGRYHLKAWQETLGETEHEVVVEAGKTTKVDFTFESKSP